MTSIYTNTTILLLLITSMAHQLSSQDKLTPHGLERSIDSLYITKDNKESPGAAVIVLKGDQVLLSKTYGMSNISFGLTFDESTLFPLESFTEQLVAFSALLLEKEGRLSLDDSVNKYLPQLGFSTKVKLLHLLNHSSGVPLMGSLRLLAGWKHSDPFDHDEFVGLVKRISVDSITDQEYQHSHAGIKLLMMVIEKVTESSFSDYAISNLFKPLRMNSTSIKYPDQKLSNIQAINYTSLEGEYVPVRFIDYEISCPITYTTITDFQKWMINMQSKAFHGDIVEVIDKALVIDGEEQQRSYGSFCIGQCQYRHYLGQDEYYMRETVNGHSWMWLRLDQADISIMSMTNIDEYIGPQVNGIADLFHEYDQSGTNPNTRNDSEFSITEKEMEKYTGTYWNDQYLYTTEISIQDGVLYHADIDNGFNFTLTPLSDGMFLTPFGGTIEFWEDDNSNKKMRNIIPNGRVFDYDEYEKPLLSNQDLSNYEGVYCSKKLNVFYNIIRSGDQLILRRNRKEDLLLTPIGLHRFKASDLDFRLIEFDCSLNKKVKAMIISNAAIQALSFEPLN